MKKVIITLFLGVGTSLGMMADVRYQEIPNGEVAGPEGNKVAVEWFTPSIVRIYRYT